MSYEQVRRELQAGTPAEMICATCPWNRPCIAPPDLTRTDIERRINDAKAKANGTDGRGEGALAATLLTAIMLGGRDQMGEMCPVFISRLAGPDGRQLADKVREQMRTWGEPQ